MNIYARKGLYISPCPWFMHWDFRYSLSKNSAKKISPNVLEYDGNIRNNWNESYLKRTFFWRLRLIFIWQVLWYSFGEDKLHRKISEDCERIFICTKTLCLSLLWSQVSNNLAKEISFVYSCNKRSYR